MAPENKTRVSHEINDPSPSQNSQNEISPKLQNTSPNLGLDLLLLLHARKGDSCDRGFFCLQNNIDLYK